MAAWHDMAWWVLGVALLATGCGNGEVSFGRSGACALAWGEDAVVLAELEQPGRLFADADHIYQASSAGLRRWSLCGRDEVVLSVERPSVLADGTFFGIAQGENQAAIWQLPALGGSPETVTSFEGGGELRSIATHDGRLYWARAEEPSTIILETLAPDGGQQLVATRTTDPNGSFGSLRINDDGLYLWQSYDPTSSLLHVPHGGEPTTVSGSSDLRSYALSPGAVYLAVGEANIRRIRRRPGAHHRAGRRQARQRRYDPRRRTAAVLGVLAGALPVASIFATRPPCRGD